MQPFPASTQLAREDRFIRTRAQRTAELRVQSGLTSCPDLRTLESLRHCLHGLLVHAIQAMVAAGRTVHARSGEVPWALTMDMARRVWDASRQVDICMRLLEHVEEYIGAYPETTLPGRGVCLQTPAERVAGVNHGPEGLPCDVLAQLMELAKQISDPVLERALDYGLADALTHVRMGGT